jgi:metal-responsive CopG/Arc/MetJ family transcriptional regulator
MNITLPANLAKALEKIAAPRKRSQFVAEALEDKLKQLSDHRLEKALEEGYKANKNEGLLMTKEFESSDLEGWHEY